MARNLELDRLNESVNLMTPGGSARTLTAADAILRATDALGRRVLNFSTWDKGFGELREVTGAEQVRDVVERLHAAESLA